MKAFGLEIGGREPHLDGQRLHPDPGESPVVASVVGIAMVGAGATSSGLRTRERITVHQTGRRAPPPRPVAAASRRRPVSISTIATANTPQTVRIAATVVGASASSSQPAPQVANPSSRHGPGPMRALSR